MKATTATLFTVGLSATLCVSSGYPRLKTGSAMEFPEPQTEDGMSLATALTQRRSVRDFEAEPLTEEQLGQLCWAAQGITCDEGYRTAPSAGGLYPIQLYVATAKGLARYDPDGHRLIQKRSQDVRATLERHALNQSAVGAAPACLVIVADVRRTARKYGRRAERYCLLEAGHVCQNILLQATALELGGVPIGAFKDEKVSRYLGLSESEQPCYLVPVGHPRR